MMGHRQVMVESAFAYDRVWNAAHLGVVAVEAQSVLAHFAFVHRRASQGFHQRNRQERGLDLFRHSL